MSPTGPQGAGSQKDRNQTQAAKHNPRPQSFYTIALKSQKEAMADQEMVSKDLAEQLEVLKRKQQENPKLNLKGLTLTEHLFFDAYQYTKDQTHLDETGYDRCLEEVVQDNSGKPTRALSAIWHGDGSRFEVYSNALAYSNFGARLAAVSS